MPIPTTAAVSKGLLSIREAAKAFRSNDHTNPVDLLTNCLDRINAINPTINAITHTADRAILKGLATGSSDRIRKGNARSLLEGIPIAIKGNICTKSLPTTCASKILGDSPSPYDATVTKLLNLSGAITPLKTNLDEFGMGSSNLHSAHGPTLNPYSKNRVAGGSSGGSAAAVSSGMVMAALGSDTGGSVRLPASYCGVVGFKPSLGRVSRWGLVAYASSLDTVGILARGVDDVEIVFDVLDKPDANDSTSFAFPDSVSQSPTTSTSPDIDMSKMRIGVPSEYFIEGLSDASISTWNKGIHHLESLGATIAPISLPHTFWALPVYYVLAPAEASSNLARYDGIRFGVRKWGNEGNNNGDVMEGELESLYATRTFGFGDEVRRRLILGTFVLSEKSYETYYAQAQKIRRLVQQDFDNVFRVAKPFGLSGGTSNDGVDAILTPASISAAPRLDEVASEGHGPVAECVNDVMTVPASLAGIPALVVPFGVANTVDGDMPVGLQLIGQFGDDKRLLRIGKALEKGRLSMERPSKPNSNQRLFVPPESPSAKKLYQPPSDSTSANPTSAVKRSPGREGRDAALSTPTQQQQSSAPAAASISASNIQRSDSRDGRRNQQQGRGGDDRGSVETGQGSSSGRNDRRRRDRKGDATGASSAEQQRPKILRAGPAPSLEQKDKEKPPKQPPVILAKPVAASSSTTQQSVPIAKPTSSAPPKSKVKILKMIDDRMRLNQDVIPAYLSESPGCYIIGVLGRRGVGKSTILNILANDLDTFPVGSGSTMKTVGIDLTVTMERIVLLDCQPIVPTRRPAGGGPGTPTRDSRKGGGSDNPIQHAGLANSPSEQLTIFLFSVCHVILVVSDEPKDEELWAFMRRIERVKYRADGGTDDTNTGGKRTRRRGGGWRRERTNTGDSKGEGTGSGGEESSGGEDNEDTADGAPVTSTPSEANPNKADTSSTESEIYFPEVIFVFNKASGDDFSPESHARSSNAIRRAFRGSRLRTSGILTMGEPFKQYRPLSGTVAASSGTIEEPNFWIMPIDHTVGAPKGGSSSAGTAVSSSRRQAFMPKLSWPAFDDKDNSKSGGNDKSANKENVYDPASAFIIPMPSTSLLSRLTPGKLEALMEQTRGIPARYPIMCRLLRNYIFEVPRFLIPPPILPPSQSGSGSGGDMAAIITPKRWFQVSERDWFRSVVSIWDSVRRGPGLTEEGQRNDEPRERGSGGG
ncbi:Trimeric GatFAB AmidoTransferase(AdT) complex subunit, partial [Blyttiomyces sp. JEL0837]